MAGIDERRKSGGVLAAILAIAAMALFCLVVFVIVAVGWEYRTGLRKSQERLIRVTKQIEEREARRRDAKLSGDKTENP